MKRWVLVLFLAFCIDRFIKRSIWFWSESQFYEAVPFIYPIVNYNASFSIPIAPVLRPVGFIIIVLLTGVLIGYTTHLIRKKEAVFFWWGLIAIGAVSNLMDRVLLGGVFDYISFGIFPVFNLSDVYITIGVGMIFLGELTMKHLPRFRMERR